MEQQKITSNLEAETNLDRVNVPDAVQPSFIPFLLALCGTVFLTLLFLFILSWFN